MSAKRFRRSVSFLYIVLLVGGLASCSSDDQSGSGQRSGRSSRANNNKASSDDGNGRSASPTAIGNGANKKGGPKNAGAILRDMCKQYASCASYRDTGQIKTTIKVGRFKSGGEVGQHFHTDFVRPDHFRFEYSTQNPFGYSWVTNVLWGSGETMRSFGALNTSKMIWNRGGTSEESDAEGTTWPSVLRHAAEVSEIPVLLMPDSADKTTRKSGIRAMRKIRLKGEEEVDGTLCYMVSGTMPDKKVDGGPNLPFMSGSTEIQIQTKITLWIEKDRKLLRKLVYSIRQTDSSTFSVPGGPRVTSPDVFATVEKTFTPEMNEELSWHETAYAPPGHSEVDEVELGGAVADDFKATKKDEAAAQASAANIIEKTITTYASCKSYRDKGVIESAAIDRSEEASRRLGFKTAFVRPDRFRYECREGGDADSEKKRQILWFKGDKRRVWSSERPETESPDSLRPIFDEIQRQTRLRVNMVCALLVAEQLGESFLTKAKELRLLGYEGIDGKACYKICGRDQDGLMFRIWIEKKSKLVRRLEAKSHGLGMPVWITLTCEPRLNKKVSKKHLKFGAPK